jgi:hypothetical protein
LCIRATVPQISQQPTRLIKESLIFFAVFISSLRFLDILLTFQIHGPVTNETTALAARRTDAAVLGRCMHPGTPCAAN